MGWCADFGCQITAGCDHPMVAAQRACGCRECGTVCQGRFAGCSEVWATGLRSGAPLRVKSSPHGHAPVVSGRTTVPPEPPTPAPAPEVPDDMQAAMESLRGDVDGLHQDLARTVRELQRIGDMVTDQGKVLREVVDALRGELHTVSEQVAGQQTILAGIAETQATTPSIRRSYEKLVQDLRVRSAPSPSGREEQIVNPL